MTNQSLGKYGEQLAVQYLQSKGYRIIARNLRNKLGEIDLVAKDGAVICFVEVKTRKSLQFGAPYEAVGRHKQYKMAQLAMAYLNDQTTLTTVPARFDVVSIYKTPAGAPQIEHFPDAFSID